MQRPQFLFRTCCALLLLVLFAGCAVNPLLPGEIRFSWSELGEKMAKRFPVEKSVAGLLDVTVTNPRLAAREDGAQRRLGLSFDVQVKLTLSGKTMFGIVTMSGLPRYDPATRAIYVDDTRVDSLRTDNMPDGLSAALGKAASAIARESVDGKALHTFKEEELHRYGFSLAPQRIDIRTEGIALVLR